MADLDDAEALALECVACNASSLEVDPACTATNDDGNYPLLEFIKSGCVYCKGHHIMKYRGMMSWQDSKHVYMGTMHKHPQ